MESIKNNLIKTIPKLNKQTKLGKIKWDMILEADSPNRNNYKTKYKMWIVLVSRIYRLAPLGVYGAIGALSGMGGIKSPGARYYLEFHNISDSTKNRFEITTYPGAKDLYETIQLHTSDANKFFELFISEEEEEKENQV